MTALDVAGIVAGMRESSVPGVVEDGTRIHVRYSPHTERSEGTAETGFPSDWFTGRLSRVWRSKNGDLLLTMFVELERDHQYRTLNADKGVVHDIRVMGD